MRITGTTNAPLTTNASLRQLFVIILFLALFSMALRPIADPDFWWHLRTGQVIFETRAIPHADPFSFTNQGKTWVAHEWLSEILLYGIYRIGGYGLLILIFAAIITATFLLVPSRSPTRARPGSRTNGCRRYCSTAFIASAGMGC